MAPRTKKIIPEDHRVRVGRERREKMRKRLLTAVMSSYATRKEHDTPVIDDIIKSADVSRATFYSHFLSLEEAVDTLGQDLAEEMMHSLEVLFKRNHTPLQRMARGTQVFLLRGVTDSLWGLFVSRTDYLSRNTYLLQTIAGDLMDARKLKLVEFSELEAATSLFVGAMMEAIRHLVKTDQRSRAYVEELTVMILRGLGVEREVAKEVVHEQAIYIRGLAPDRLSWWRDPWRPS